MAIVFKISFSSVNEIAYNIVVRCTFVFKDNIISLRNSRLSYNLQHIGKSDPFSSPFPAV